MSKAFERVHDVLTDEGFTKAITTAELAAAASVSIPTAKKHALALVEMGVVKTRMEYVSFKHNPWNYDPGMRAGYYRRAPYCELWGPNSEQ